MVNIRWWGFLLFLTSVLSVAKGQNSSSLTGVFCVAIATADQNTLLDGLNWACGPGGADCGPIQPGQPCYVANNVVELASYAFNDYYHKNAATGATCSFNGTAMTTNTDPSHDSCIFAGSTQASTGTGTNSTTNSTSGFTPTPTPTPTTSLFGPPPPPGLTGLFPNATSPSTDGTLGGLGAGVSLHVLYVPYILVVMSHLFYCYV
ncbi:hypothetical protein LUZ60_006766 [Juncus effusus]|nr:hypothetical protein LUZ60_006766 [Juncus effusus]